MRTHKLKTWPSFFEALREGSKTYEVRRNDRDFAVGDLLDLREWEPDGVGHWTGRAEYRVVTHILHGGDFGIERGYCVMAISPSPVGQVLADLAKDGEA